MDHLAARVLDLAFTGKRHGKDLAVRAGFQQDAGRIFHGGLGTQVRIHPLHGAFLVNHRALGHQVIHVGGPVLDGRVTHTRVLFYEDLDHTAVEMNPVNIAAPCSLPRNAPANLRPR